MGTIKATMRSSQSSAMNAGGCRRWEGVGCWLLGQLVGVWPPSPSLALPCTRDKAHPPPAVEMKHLSQLWIAPRGPFWGLSFVSPCFLNILGKSWRAQVGFRAVNDASAPRRHRGGALMAHPSLRDGAASLVGLSPALGQLVVFHPCELLGEC